MLHNNKSFLTLSLLSTIFTVLSIFSSADCAPNVVKDINIKGRPYSIALDEQGARLFVLHDFNNMLSVINEKDLSTIKEVFLNKKRVESDSIAYDSALNHIYVPTGYDGVTVVDGENYETLFDIKNEIDKGYTPDLAVGESYLYVLDLNGYILRYDKKGKLDRSIEIKDKNMRYLGSSFMRLGRSNRLYISFGVKGLIVFDGKAGRVVSSIPINAFSVPESGGDKIYVAGPEKLYIIDAKGLKVKKVIDVDYPNKGGLGMAINPKTGRLFLVTMDDTVTVVDTKKMKKVDKLKVCAGPRSIAINKTTNTVYVACPNSRTITVIKDE